MSADELIVMNSKYIQSSVKLLVPEIKNYEVYYTLIVDSREDDRFMRMLVKFIDDYNEMVECELDSYIDELRDHFDEQCIDNFEYDEGFDYNE